MEVAMNNKYIMCTVTQVACKSLENSYYGKKSLFLIFIIAMLLNVNCHEKTSNVELIKLNKTKGKISKTTWLSNDNKWVCVNREFLNELTNNPNFSNLERYYDELNYLICKGDVQAVKTGITLLAKIPFDGAAGEFLEKTALLIYNEEDVLWHELSKLDVIDKNKLFNIYDEIKPLDWESAKVNFTDK